MNKRLSVRANVMATLNKIHQGQSLSLLLDDLLCVIDDGQKAFAHQLLLGTLRQWHAINRLHDSLVKTPITDTLVICALNMGLYELLYMSTPDYALINETINALKSLGKAHSTGFINAILRKVANNKDKFTKKVAKNHSLPNWLAKQLKQDWGDYYDKLGYNLRQAAPIFLRPNSQSTDIATYADILQAHHINHSIVPIGLDKACILLDDTLKITALPHFADGLVSVQDRHAQLAIAILHKYALGSLNQHTIRLLDACAAPGGKLMQLLELFHVEQNSYPNTHIIALDNNPKRLQRLQDNLARLQLTHDNLQLICDDATTFGADEPFDVIILDVPCSATGVIRRHPDINVLRQADDIGRLVQLQQQILQNAWQNLAVGGYLLYITCSLLKQENVKQLLDFVADRCDVCVIDFTLNLTNQIKQTIGYQCLPLNNNDGDGFYYGLLQKTA